MKCVYVIRTLYIVQCMRRVDCICSHVPVAQTMHNWCDIITRVQLTFIYTQKSQRDIAKYMWKKRKKIQIKDIDIWNSHKSKIANRNQLGSIWITEFTDNASNNKKTKTNIDRMTIEHDILNCVLPAPKLHSMLNCTTCECSFKNVSVFKWLSICLNNIQFPFDLIWHLFFQCLFLNCSCRFPHRKISKEKQHLHKYIHNTHTLICILISFVWFFWMVYLTWSFEVVCIAIASHRFIHFEVVWFQLPKIKYMLKCLYYTFRVCDRYVRYVFK